jgi:hypothetical protein
MTTVLPFVALTVAAIVAGCSGKGYGGSALTGATPSPLPTATGQCVFPAGETAQMIFPQNGGVGVANLQGVVFAVAPSPLPTNWYMYANSTFGSTQNTSSIGFLATPAPSPTPVAGVASPTPLPTPSDTPTVGPVFVLETASIGNFANSTAFTIFLANTNCATGINMGTFTTNAVDTPPTPTPAPT